MRKIIVLAMTSVDGYFAGTDGNLDWQNADEEFMRYGIKVLDGADTMLFGRVTYDFYESYWPQALDNPGVPDIDRIAAKRINKLRKIVFSTSKKQPYWQNSEVRGEIDPDEIQQLKEEGGKDIVICGSGTIVRQLTGLGLIDEYQLVAVPVILGAGKQLFGSVPQTGLKSIRAKRFDSGNQLVVYQKS